MSLQNLAEQLFCISLHSQSGILTVLQMLKKGA